MYHMYVALPLVTFTTTPSPIFPPPPDWVDPIERFWALEHQTGFAYSWRDPCDGLRMGSSESSCLLVLSRSQEECNG